MINDKEKLVEMYRDFIRGTVEKFKKKYRCRLNKEDLCQEAVAVLLTTLPNQDRKKIILRAIENAIYKELKQKGLTQKLKKEFARYRNIRAKLFEKLRRSPTLDELITATQWSHEKTESLERFYQTALTYDE